MKSSKEKDQDSGEKFRLVSAPSKESESAESTVQAFLEKRRLVQEKLGMKLLQAVYDFDHKLMEELLEEGAPVNYQDKETLATALHFAAAAGDRKAILSLLRTNQCDLLIKDRRGRLPATLATIGAGDAAAAHLLRHLQEKQALVRGIDSSFLRYEV